LNGLEWIWWAVSIAGGGLGFAAVFRKLRKSSKNQGEGKLRFFCGKVLKSICARIFDVLRFAQKGRKNVRFL
jgi:hypothetical protein